MQSIEPKHSDFRGYPGEQLKRFTVYTYTGSPCTAPTTETTIYKDPSTDLLYSDMTATELYSGNFFLDSDKSKSYYFNAVNGVIGDPVNNLCPEVQPDLYWKSLGTPTAMSRNGNIVLAAYGSCHVVVKFNFSNNERNPLGVIVAGEWLKMQRSANDSYNYLNFPLLVQWKTDGTQFAVYSAGNHKSIKVFSANGDYMWSTDLRDYFGSTDANWRYNINSNGYSETINSSVSTLETKNLLRKLTGSQSNLNDNWIPTKLQFPATASGVSNTNGMVLMLIQRKSNVSGSNVLQESEIWTINKYAYLDTTTVNRVYQYGFNLPSSGNTTRERLDNAPDMFSDFSVMRITHPTSSTSTIEVALVYPRSPQTGGTDQYKRHRMPTFLINMNWNLEYTVTNTDTSQRILNITNQNRIFDKNVRAYCQYIGNSLYIVIKNSKTSWWSNLMRYRDTAATTGLAAGLMVLAAQFIPIVSTTGSLAWMYLGMYSWTVPVVGWITGGLILLGVFLTFLFRKKPKSSDSVTLRHTIGGTMNSPTITTNYGVIDPPWGNNRVEYTDILFDCKTAGSDAAIFRIEYTENGDGNPTRAQLYRTATYTTLSSTIVSDRTDLI